MSNVVHLQIKNNLLHLDATEIAEAIQNKIITSEEVTSTYIEHIKQVNKSLNAVVEDRFSEALEEAKEKDEQIDNVSFTQQPLYGVPISIKESLNVAGMKTTGGISHRKDITMNKDADVVRTLKAAGAIVLCKTNTPSLCFYHETVNKLYGRTNNAWSKKHTAGGSSGGEAALISVGGSTIGMSSDIGGSIRFPSHFNGVVGFKPGKYQVSSEGHFPPDNIPLKARMTGVGPIGKSVRDVQLVYQIIQKELVRKGLYEKMQVDLLPTDMDFPLGNQTRDLLDKVHAFIQHHYEASMTIPPFFNDSAEVWQEIMSIDGGKEIQNLAFNIDRVHIMKEYMKSKFSNKTNLHPQLLWALVGAHMFKPSQKRAKEIESFIEEGDNILDRYLSNRLLVFPVYHSSAPLHGELFKEIFSIKRTFTEYMPYIAYANVWGLPSLTMPIGEDLNGLPIGVQIMSKNGNEHAIFRLGKKLEKEFGGYKRSTLYDS